MNFSMREFPAIKSLFIKGFFWMGGLFGGSDRACAEWSIRRLTSFTA